MRFFLGSFCLISGVSGAVVSDALVPSAASIDAVSVPSTAAIDAVSPERFHATLQILKENLKTFHNLVVATCVLGIVTDILFLSPDNLPTWANWVISLKIPPEMLLYLMYRGLESSVSIISRNLPEIISSEDLTEFSKRFETAYHLTMTLVSSTVLGDKMALLLAPLRWLAFKIMDTVGTK